MEVKRFDFFSRQEEMACPRSDPTNLHMLRRVSENRYKFHYYCDFCDLIFDEYKFFPPEIKHPFHLLHPLTLFNPYRCDNGSSPEVPQFYNFSGADDDEFHEEKEDGGSDGNHQKCKFCGKSIDGDNAYYHCPTCNFSIHFYCAVNPPPLQIPNPKHHDHTLTLLPRRVPFPCDACGFSLSALFSQVYSCLLCNYLVHRSCIYLPLVIKITRHSHRLSFTSSAAPSGDRLPCGVCRRPVDVNCGRYLCSKGCQYAIHSKCATRKKVWDGKDLEGEPEEEEEEVIDPFVRIDEETIQHFSHDHHNLKLHGKDDNRSNHESKYFCQACTLTITVSDRLYSCMECDFVLHETCASLPRKKNHPLHRHALTLSHPFSPIPHKVGPEYYSHGFFDCDGCGRGCCGFVYKCDEKDCDFQLDVRCASLTDPSSHELHEHPLFFNLTKGECMRCQEDCSHMYLECVECKVFIGLECATFPSVAHYKHDKHPLTLCYGEEGTTAVQYWCEICEKKLDGTKWFYTCKSCLVTLHVTCLLGGEIYMKPNHTINSGGDVDIICNNGSVRPVCDGCRGRCIYPFVFKQLDKNSCRWECTTCIFTKRQKEMHSKFQISKYVERAALNLINAGVKK